MRERHWDVSEDGVTVKLTMVTREHRSGGKCTALAGTAVARNSVKEGEQSMSCEQARAPSEWPLSHTNRGIAHHSEAGREKGGRGTERRVGD